MKKYIICTTLILVLSFFCLPVSAQETNEKSFDNGTVLISYIGTYLGRNFEISNEAYSPYLLGVYYDDNSNDVSDPRKFRVPIKTGGITWVRYTDSNGAIKKGDPVTSSNIPGVAMKATAAGMILGIALEDATNPNGLVHVRIMVQYMR